MTTFDLRTLDLDALNSATKYPSIPTYHAINPEDGRLTDEVAVTFDGAVYVTEKIDGTNGRIILLPGGQYVIGSRDQLLHARGDIIANPSLRIVEALRPTADRLLTEMGERHQIAVFFVEVYGGKTTPAAREYTSTGQLGVRFFDIAYIPTEVLDWPREQIAGWRERGEQSFWDFSSLRELDG